MFESFGFDEHFLKCFLHTERDSTEVQYLLDYMSKWDGLEKEVLEDMLHQSSIYFLERFAIQGNF